MKWVKFFLISLFFILSFYSFAEEQSLNSVNYSYTQISDASFFHTTIIQFINHRRDLLYNYINEKETAWDYGGSVYYIQGFNSKYNFDGEKILLTIGRKFSSNFYQSISLGINNYYDSLHQKNYQEFIGESKSTFLVSEILSGFLGIVRDNGYVFSLQPGSISDGLLVTKLFGLLTIRYHKDWMSRISQDYLLINDGNQKSVTNLSLLYGVSTSTPWIWIGVGFEYTGCTYITTNYWSPSGFLAYGTRAESDFPLIDNKLSLGINFNYNRTYDNNSKIEGNGFSFSTKLTLGNRNNHNASIYYNRIDSSQNGNSWISNEFGVSVNLTF